MNQKRVENATSFEQPLTLLGLEEELQQALEEGLSVDAYEKRLADQRVLCKSQSREDQAIWEAGRDARLAGHLHRAMKSNAPTLVAYLWAQVPLASWDDKTATGPLHQAICSQRLDWFDSALACLNGGMPVNEIQSLYNQVLLNADGPILARLMTRFPDIPDPYYVGMMLDYDVSHLGAKVDLVLATPMAWRAGPIALLTKLLNRGLWNQAEQVWARDPLTATEDDEHNVLDALDIALTQANETWSNRLIALLPPGNPQGTGWEILATNLEDGKPSEQLADQARRLGPVARRKVWAKYLQEEKWEPLDRLSSLVPLSWVQAMADMPEVIAQLPQAQARLRAEHLKVHPARPFSRPRRRA